MESPVRSTLIFPETRVSSPKSPQCSIASCSPPISPRQEILSDRDLHPPPKQKLKQKQKEKQKLKQKQKEKQKRKHWGPCASDKPFPCSHSRSHSDEGHVDGPRRKRRKIRFFQNRFSKGDVVWAKAFPYTWWPGWIGRIEGSFAWVSFYGCKMSRWFRVLEICGFEESYGRISKMAGVKLADEINLALEDFSRRTVIALTSCCWVSPVESSGVSADHIAGVRERFDSREMLRFVNDLGVSALVADEETARVVRLSAQVYAYRSYASMCRHSELAGDFSAADMLEFARDFAVSLFIDSVGDSVLSAVLDRFDEFRRFVSVCPRWMYRQRVELEEAFPSDEPLDHLTQTFGGRSGYLRGLGCGPKPLSAKNLTIKASEEYIERQINVLKEELKQSKVENEERVQREKIERDERLKKEVEEIKAQLQTQFNEQLNIIVGLYGVPTAPPPSSSRGVPTTLSPPTDGVPTASPPSSSRGVPTTSSPPAS